MANTRRHTDHGNYLLLKMIFIIVFLTALFFNQLNIINGRKQHLEQSHALELQSLPPALALTTIAFGPLRGLIANAVWWRIMEQQDQGNYFEINQLADWITTMQPRNSQVWSYQAWNLAFNVAAEFPDKETKWKWVLRGIELLTQRGLRINPGNQKLKNELARIYFDRIGYEAEGSKYFQKQWAYLMVKFLPNGNRKELEEIADAPASKKELMALTNVKQLVDKTRQADLDILEPNVFYGYQRWPESSKQLITNDKETQEALKIIDSYFRGQKLRFELNLDPKRMLYIDQQYGPFDWRLYQGYVVYWAATGSFDEYMKEKLNYQPLIRLAMEKSFMEGKLILDEKAGIFVTTNNIAIIGRLHDYYDHLMEYHYTPEADRIHKRFLETASAILYTFNRLDAAQEVYNHYFDDYEKKSGKTPDFNEFIANNLQKTLQRRNLRTKRSLIESALFQAYNWMATGDMQRAIGYANFAKLVWTRHQKRYANRPDKLLPSFESMKLATYKNLMESNIAEAYRQRLDQHTDQRKLEPTQTGKVYLGDSIESGDGHRAFRERMKKEKKHMTEEGM